MAGGGGGGSNTTVQKADPWKGVQPYLLSAYQQASNLYGQDPNGRVAPMNQMQMDALNSMNQAAAGTGNLNDRGVFTAAALMTNPAYASLFGQGSNAQTGAINNLNGIAQNAGTNAAMYNQFGAGNTGNAASNLAGLINNSGTNAAMYNQMGAGNLGTAGTGLSQYADPTNNPYLQSAMQSAIRPLTQNFQENVLPSIQSGAIGAGQLGGSRQGIAQGIAARGYQDAVGDITTNMGNNAYNQGLTALQSLGSLGNAQSQLGSNYLGQMSNNAQALGSLGNAQSQLGFNYLGQSAGASQGAAGIGSDLQSMITRNQALGLGSLGTLYQGALLPGQTALNSGSLYQQQAQNYANAPYQNISDYLGLLTNGAALGGTSQSTASQSGGNSRLTGAAGGAAAGSMFGPWGTAIGAGLGYFLS